jgi:ubiquinone/menaquinone biosynthesis C-methylase UbiE
MNNQNSIEEGWLFHNHAWHLLHEIIKLIPTDTKNLLDVGGGTGIAAAIIRAVYPDIVPTVVDISENCVSFWEKRKIDGFVLKGNVFPFSYKRFDFVMSSHVLEHLKEPVILIKELWRVCKKRLVIVVPDGDIHFHDHQIIYNRTNFKEIIQHSLADQEYTLKAFPLYHPHMNNLIAVVDRI